MSKATGKLAKRITRELMTSGGTTVERLQLMHKQEDGTERNMCGMCTECVEEIIQAALEEALCG